VEFDLKILLNVEVGSVAAEMVTFFSLNLQKLTRCGIGKLLLFGIS
jgi:hypothetical protein